MNKAGCKGLDGRFDLRHVLGQIPADLQQDCRSALSSGWKDRLGRISVAVGQQHDAMSWKRLPDMRQPGEVRVLPSCFDERDRTEAGRKQQLCGEIGRVPQLLGKDRSPHIPARRADRLRNGLRRLHGSLPGRIVIHTHRT